MNTLPGLSTTSRPRWWRAAAWAAAVAALVAVFAAWLNPHFARDMADWVWSCF